MAALPASTIKKIARNVRKDLKERIEQKRIEKNYNEFRSHLGASQIGDSCERKLFYGFRWAKRPDFPANVLRLFETGQLAEHRISKELRSIGATVMEVDPQTGKQWRYVELQGHFGGSMDGAICIDDQWYVGEYKTHNEKSFKELIKKGVKSSKFQHFAQMQIYMRLSGMTKALYFAVNKNNDEIYLEEVSYDEGFSETLINKARRVIFALQAPPKLSETPDYFECRWCDFTGICHGEEIPVVNCRTCNKFSINKSDSYCSLREEPLALEDERQGCSFHHFRPDFLPFNLSDSSMREPTGNCVTYLAKDGTTFKNGYGHVASSEIQHLELLKDENVKLVKEVFPGAKITKVTENET